jgi:pimeloyl-ACP methyl ester carboxylesterase
MSSATTPVPATEATSSSTGRTLSRDGTPIAYDRAGQGPPLVIVDGAFCTRTMGPGKVLAPHLAGNFTVYTYDRRGRGGSGDTAPYAVEREVEDLAAVIAEAGGSAYVFGSSSGAALALEAARRGLAITRLALYEAPFVVDDSRPPVGDDYLARVKALIAADRRGAAIRLFMTEGIRVPTVMVMTMPLMVPIWAKLKAVAPTLPNDTTIMDEYLHGRPLPSGRWATMTVPTLVIAGGKSPAWIQHGMLALADALPDARHRTLAGQTHMVKPKATVPELVGFFGESTRGPATPGDTGGRP